MTRRQYIFAYFLKKLGYTRKQNRLQNAGNETQLLRDAEEILGRNVWRNVRDIENYKPMHNQIILWIGERDDFIKKIEDIKTQLNNIELEKKEELDNSKNAYQHTSEQHGKQHAIVSEIKSKIEQISNIGANLKVSHDQTLAKIEELKNSGSSLSEIKTEEDKIARLKDKFANLKNKKTESDRELAKQYITLEELTKTLTEFEHAHTNINNSEARQKAKRTIAVYRSKVSGLDNEILNLYRDIGHNISQECFTNDNCKRAVQEKINICKIIKSLRKSIDFNNNLGDRYVG